MSDMIEVLKDEKNELRISVKSNLTLINLLNENLWNQTGVKFAGYVKKHPYLGNPEILVKAANPKRVLISALDDILKDTQSLKKQLKNAFD